MITELRLGGTTDQPATVTVESVADTDPAAQAFAVEFLLDGGAGVGHLPADPGLGVARSYELEVVAAGGGGVATETVGIDLQP